MPPSGAGAPPEAPGERMADDERSAGASDCEVAHLLAALRAWRGRRASLRQGDAVRAGA